MVWIVVCIIAAVIICGWFAIGYVGFRTAICRGHELNINDREALKGTAWDQYYDEIQEGIAWINQQKAEDIYIQSEDGLKLHARLMDQPGAKGTVLMFHGYRTHPEVDFSASSHVYYECGNRIVHIDQRAAGKSEGKYIGFGVLESRDGCLWAQYIANRFGTDQKIILAGLSMGASTALMSTAHHENKQVQINSSSGEILNVSMELPENVKVIARAGAGVNNIPVDVCAEKGIVVFNTPGANANGVKELVLAGMLLASRDIVGGIEWVAHEEDKEHIDKLAEKQKKQFAGCEISGKKLGIIGLGAIGAMVANSATHLGMEVYGYDPFISIDAAWNLSRTIKHSKSLDEIYSQCDYITIHVPLTDNTRKMIDKEAFTKMKDGVVLLNFARDLLVDEEALIEALDSGKVKKYVTDFANPLVAGRPGILVTPHLGASTAESEENCAVMAVKEVRDFLENGNIKNSVNFPNCDMGTCIAVGRITICHKNIPNMISQFTKILGSEGLNIADMTNKSRGSYAYTIIDLESAASKEALDELKAIEGVSKVRVIK